MSPTANKHDEGRLMQVLIGPIVSEKATMVAEKSNAVAFRVLQDAAKPEIRAAFELMLNVEFEESSATFRSLQQLFGEQVAAWRPVSLVPKEGG